MEVATRTLVLSKPSTDRRAASAIAVTDIRCPGTRTSCGSTVSTVSRLPNAASPRLPFSARARWARAPCASATLAKLLPARVWALRNVEPPPAHERATEDRAAAASMATAPGVDECARLPVRNADTIAETAAMRPARSPRVSVVSRPVMRRMRWISVVSSWSRSVRWCREERSAIRASVSVFATAHCFWRSNSVSVASPDVETTLAAPANSA
mmetsp:Transcript_51488/g.158664  ORF Transcript_51488/g.158664 Transcript_51488/m.158664 type:complete len:212 (+) Transcript_51488:505-1140(+)